MIVSALLLQRDGHTTRKVEAYLGQFAKLARTGLNIVCFIDPKISAIQYPNVRYIPINIIDLHTFTLMQNCTEVSVDDNVAKNTLDFHIIQTSKTELCTRALSFTNDERINWVDFGIGHVIKNESVLMNLKHTEKLKPGVTIPGCWPFKTNFTNKVSWRFCGGFFSADRASLIAFNDLVNKMVTHTAQVATWEVNTWARIEYYGLMNFNWYKADHNDSILNFPIQT